MEKAISGLTALPSKGNGKSFATAVPPVIAFVEVGFGLRLTLLCATAVLPVTAPDCMDTIAGQNTASTAHAEMIHLLCIVNPPLSFCCFERFQPASCTQRARQCLCARLIEIPVASSRKAPALIEQLKAELLFLPLLSDLSL
jgi:hypothetical protein